MTIRLRDYYDQVEAILTARYGIDTIDPERLAAAHRYGLSPDDFAHAIASGGRHD